MTFSELISKHREEKNLGMRELAELVGLSYQSIYNMEHMRAHGQLVMASVPVISKVLGIPVQKLAKAALESTKVYTAYKKITEQADDAS
jgi:transcriptional regulator with XRE-family HTH domain